MRIFLLIFGILSSSYVWAGFYKCTDSEGKTTYQKSPCARQNISEEVNVRTGTRKEIVDDTAIKEAEKKEQQKRQLSLEELNLQKKLRKEQQLKESAVESKKSQELINKYKQKFSPYAIPPYTEERVPDIVASYESRLPDIERLRRSATLKVLASKQCERVESSELDIKSPIAKLRFWVDCSNGERFFFNEKQIAVEEEIVEEVE